MLPMSAAELLGKRFYTSSIALFIDFDYKGNPFSSKRTTKPL
jgi:hypothetical protein